MMNQLYELNGKGRDFVIGDLHGRYDLFVELLADLKFDTENDRMFSVGDLIDRGNNSIECLRLIAKNWFHAVMGNHEDMMIRALDGTGSMDHWVINGGAWHLNEDKDELNELAKLTKELPHAITVKTKNGDIGICHAQPPSLDWDDAINSDPRSKTIMLWSRSWIADKSMPNVGNITATYHGHTPIEEPITMGNVNFIDTGAVFNGNLTCKKL